MTYNRLLLLVLTLGPGAIAADFAKDVQPIFGSSCCACHGPKLQMGGLRLDSKKQAISGGEIRRAHCAR